MQNSIEKLDGYMKSSKEKDSSNPALRNIVLELNMEGLDVENDKVKGSRCYIAFSRTLDSTDKSTAKEILTAAGFSDIRFDMSKDGKRTVVEFDS